MLKKFLQAHYEKLILLILLLFCAFMLWYQVGYTQKVQDQKIDEIINRKEPESDYSAIDQAKVDFKTELVFSDPMTIGFPKHDPESKITEMMSPYSMAECVYCHNLIPSSAFPAIGEKQNGKCPVCGKALQPKVKQEETKLVNNDSNSNSIPDDWEAQFSLSNISPDSDEDKDHFTLLEEYNAKTNPTDPKSHPLYVSYLKVYTIKSQEIKNLKLVSVEAPAGAEKSKWEAQFNTLSKNRKRTSFCRINAGTFENNGISYTVTDIKEDPESSEHIVYIQPVGSTDVVIECRKGKTIYDPNPRVTFSDKVLKRRITYSVGKNITLGTVETGKETYRIVSANSEKKTVLLQNLLDKKEFTIEADSTKTPAAATATKAAASNSK